MHNGWMDGMGWFWLLLLLLVVLFVWLVARSVSGGRGSARGADEEELSRSPEQILEERFARGEIDAAELQRRRRELRGGS